MLSENFTKLAQQTELQLAVILALREYMKYPVHFSLQSDRPADERIFWSFWLKDDILNNIVYTTSGLC